ncbi:hypothetical protein [Archangium sp.]|uniref:hypothetical protein n=1 Tax=Archangium sp. TaxID=1872627 RepID=UPI002D58FFCA|nr:hypothetical protein [Archangium sp.]HYO56870.1 hypothetical protein [Archangium sp.]
MAKNRALVTWRSPGRDSLRSVLLALLVLVGPQLATARTPASAKAEHRQDTPPTGGDGTVPPGWPDLSSSDAEELLAPFLSCTSPAGFVQVQRGVDMARLVEKLDDWSAVRLGSLGPVLPAAAEVLNRKRASFLVTATQE